MIPKFKEVLLVDELEGHKVRDALKTLNELVHHQVSTKISYSKCCHHVPYVDVNVLQETSDMMIESEILQITAGLLKHVDGEVREQAALLLGAFALSAIGR